jgi:tRNA (adenine22-N1)-methyltransferase
MPSHAKMARLVSVPLSRAELGPRLRALADAVLPGEPVGDLCCDHAWLATALVGEGRVPRAIAVDRASDPLIATGQTLAGVGLGDRLELRQGDGFRELGRGEVASVVIAGVGSSLIGRMLGDAAREDRLAGVRRVIVQANDGFPRLGDLRTQIDALGWGLVEETLVVERDRFHLIMVAEPAPAGLRVRDEIDRELGPILRRRDDRSFEPWRSRERARIQQVLVDMDAARADPRRREAFERWLAMLE